MKKGMLLFMVLGIPSAISALGLRYAEGPIRLPKITYRLYPDRKSVEEKHMLHLHLHEKNPDEYTIHQGEAHCLPLKNDTSVYFIVSWPEIARENSNMSHQLNSSARYDIVIDDSYNATLKEINPNGGYPACMPNKK